MKNELFKITFLATILMAGAFVSCKENELDPDKGQHSGKEISFSISETKTKTAYDPDDNLQINWSEGDAVRIFCDEAEDVKQADYTVTQISKNTCKLAKNENGLAWGGDDDEHNFYAVYPADDSKVSVDASTGIATFTVNHNQFCTVQGNGAVNNHYSTIPDMKEAYMVANLSTTPVPDVALNFKPIMTTLEVTVQGASANGRTVTLTGISVINKKSTYPGVSEGKFKYDITKKSMSEGAESATVETYHVGIKNGNDTWVDLQGGQSITLTVFLPPVAIDNDNQVTIQVHATGELNAIIGGRTDANGKQTNIVPSAKAKIKLPAMPETKSGNNWITPLDDKIYVQQLSIPGTHDAAAYTTFADLGTTQALNLQEQWDLGIRAFDIRPAYRNWPYSKFWVWHGFTDTDLSLEDVFNTICDNLKSNDSKGEFAIIQFRHETEAPGLVKNLDKWKTDLYSFLSKYDSQIVQWQKDLTIGQCRGKIIILTRNDYDNRTKAALVEGFPTNSSGDGTLKAGEDIAPYLVQDYYKYTGDSGAEKKRQIKELYQKTKTFSDENSQYYKQKAWALNHTSGYEGVNVIVDIEIGSTTQYQRNAANVNKTIYETLVNETDFGPTGIVFMDWVGQRTASSYTVYGDLLPQAIIEHNYKYRMLRADNNASNK